MQINSRIKMENKFSLIILIFCNILLARYSTLADSGEVQVKKNADIKKYQYMVILLNTEHSSVPTPFATGSMLSTTFLLTAAHNFMTKVDVSKYSVRSGTANKNKGGTNHNVSSVLPYPSYAEENFIHDIALVQISDPVKFDETLPLLSLMSTEAKEGTPGKLLGWIWKANIKPKRNDYLKVYDTKVSNKKKCQKLYRTSGIGLGDTIICTRDKGRGFYRTDTSAALIIEDQLAGILTRAHKTKEVTFPSVFISVYDHKQWIEDNMKEY